MTGTATAWVLVRYPFPGKGLVNALIDLPFAVPTVVTGLMLVALYGPSSVAGSVPGPHGWGSSTSSRGSCWRLLFVTYPFVIRSVQPVLLELDRAEEEAAATLGAGAWTTFRRVTLPTLWPAILTGTALSFSRALGEFGSVVMVAGNRPLETKTGPDVHLRRDRERQPPRGDGRLGRCCWPARWAILVVLNRLQRRGEEVDHGD